MLLQADEINSKEKTLSNSINVNEIKRRLVDEESLKLFDARYQYFRDGDYQKLIESIWKVLPENGWKMSLFTRYMAENFKGKKVILYGAGDNGRNFLWENRFFSLGIEILYFTDSDSKLWDKKIFGVKVISPDEAVTMNVPIIVDIGNAKIRNMLVRKFSSRAKGGVYQASDKVNHIYSCVGNQYFDCEHIKPLGDNETFVDGGAFNGATAVEFVKWCKSTYDHIYMFEPDKEMYDYCKKRYESNQVSIVNAGLWNETGIQYFDEKGNGASAISEDGGISINTTTIDEVCKQHIPTFIKFDIEGAERNALDGAKNTITGYKPRLAVCVYHTPDDIVAIPEKLIKLNPDYRFQIKHYYVADYETVLYAF